MANPTSFNKPHVRLCCLTDQEPPKLKSCVAVYANINKKLSFDHITGVSDKILYYNIIDDANPNAHWDHDEQTWDWDTYPREVLVSIIIFGGGRSVNSSDRAEPCT